MGMTDSIRAVLTADAPTARDWLATQVDTSAPALQELMRDYLARDRPINLSLLLAAESSGLLQRDGAELLEAVRVLTTFQQLPGHGRSEQRGLRTRTLPDGRAGAGHLLERIHGDLGRFDGGQLAELLDGVDRYQRGRGAERALLPLLAKRQQKVLPEPALVQALERYFDHLTLPLGGTEPGHGSDTSRFVPTADHAFTEALRHLRVQTDRALGLPPLAILAHPRWRELLGSELAALPESQRAAWQALLLLAGEAKGSAAKPRWLAAVEKEVMRLGRSEFSAVLAQLLQGLLAILPRDVPPFDVDKTFFKGLVWLAQVAEPRAIAPVLGTLGQFCYAKIAGFGARDHTVGNACVVVLGQLGRPGVLQLSRLRAKVRYDNSAQAIAKALNQAAERAGVSTDELEEAAVPDYGINHEGYSRRQFGEAIAELQLSGACTLESRWLDAAGKPLKSVPAAVKREYKAELAAWQIDLKELPSVLAAHRHRLESAYVLRRTWNGADWHERFVAHPVLGWLGRRLIWRVEDGGEARHGLWHGDRFLAADGSAQAAPAADAQLSLWHPIHSSADEVQAWRALLSRLALCQPFKQAHREIYRLTDAERETRTWSNRYTGHLLRQHALASLCRERDWGYVLMGQWDGRNVPGRALPAWNVAASFEVERDTQLNDQYSDAGIVRYVASERVRFWRCDDDQDELPLADVPPLAFSELMRDIDLFVGVCSVAINASEDEFLLLRERGIDPSYWSAQADTRRDTLVDALSRLPISPRCRLQGPYLQVQGDVRGYRIHLGSGNVLMDPNNQYLCIVEAKQSEPSLFLPFEGDRLLALILSKALLLANDRAIKDPGILAQIRQQG